MLFLFFLTVGGCGSNRENNSSVPSPVDTDNDSTPATLEGCRQYPESFNGYRYEWDDEQNAIIGHNIRYNCLSRTRIYMNKSDFINEGEVFGLDLAAEYDDIDCMEGGPSFFTNNTFDGSKLIATSYKIDDVNSELYKYTWEVHLGSNTTIPKMGYFTQ